jgi:hypothetical protein
MSAYLSGPSGPEREVIVHIRGRRYTYVGVSPPHFNKAEFYARKGWIGKMFKELKPYAVDYMKGDYNG